MPTYVTAGGEGRAGQLRFRLPGPWRTWDGPQEGAPTSPAEDASPPSRSAPRGEAELGSRFEELRPRVQRLCRRMLVEPSAAEDAAQEVYLRVERSLESYDPRQPFAPWVMAIASHYCVDVLRRRTTEQRIFREEATVAGRLVDPAPDPLGRVVQEAMRQRVIEAIEALPAKFRLPLMLRYYAELDYDAIAGVLDVSRTQVGTLLFRAKRRLRESLSGVAAAEGIVSKGRASDGEAKSPRRRRREKRTEP